MKRRLAALMLSLFLALSLIPGLVGSMPTAAAADVTDTQRGAAAAGLLGRYARGMDEPVYTSVIALYDHLMAFAGNGTATTPGAAGRTWYLLDALERRASFREGSTTQSPVVIGGTATGAVVGADEVTRTMVAAATYGQDLSAFAGRDFLTVLAGLRFNGADPGWYRTTAAGSSRVSTLIQTRAVLALKLTGQTEAAAEAAASLRGKQQASGAWGNTYTATTANFEATVLAVQALMAEGSADSVTAARAGAAYLRGLQQSNGSFTGGTTIVLIGQTANALLAAGEVAAGTLAANYIRDLQVVGSATADPLFDGGIASDAAMRDRVLGGTAAPSTFATLATNTLKGSLAWAPLLGTVRFTEPAERPALNDTNTFKDGPCVETEGVTIVIDYGYALEGEAMPDPGVIIRCALGTQATGWIALENAGIAVASVPGFVGGALCQLNGYPAAGYPLCWYSPGGYWSYWHADPGDKWNYSQLGASNRAPARGSIDGWRFVPLDGGGVPPRVGPTFPESGYVDTTAPVMAFTSGPDGVTDQGVKIVFTWSLDDLGATLSCKLDDAEWGPCGELESWDVSAQNMTLLNVPEGDHAFAVRAVDNFGNTTTMQRAFTVVPDVTPPEISITANPGLVTNVANADFTMKVGEADATVSCKLDDAEWASCTTRTTQRYTGLAAGEHTFRYRAVDLSNNTAEVSHTWTIDPDAPPVVRLTTVPSGYNGLPFNSTTTGVTVNFTVAEAGTVTSRECKLDDREWETCYSTTQARWTGLTLAEGLHTVSVRATNAAGHTSPVASYTWTVDATRPVITVTGQPPVASAFSDASVSWTVEDVNEVYQQQCTLNDGMGVPCTSPFVMKALPVGANKLTISARDVAYNWSTITTLNWEVLETVPPTLGELSLADIAHTTATASIPVTAGNLDADFVVEVRSGDDKLTTASQRVVTGESATLSFELTGLIGYTDYEARVVATDENGSTIRGAWQPFSTPGLVPAVVAAQATGITTSSASIAVTAIPGVPGAQVTVEYRVGDATATTDAVLTTASAAEQPLEIGLAGLPANAEVAYRVVATNALGMATGDWQEFTTLPVKPELVTTSVTGLTARSATLAVTAVPGSLDATVAVEYVSGGTTRTTPATAVAGSLAPDTVSIDLSGLAPNGTVRYRAIVSSAAGTVTGGWQEFTTPQVGAPEVSLSASTATLVIGEKVTLTWRTDEATQVTAGGDWSGKLTASGSKTVTLSKPGEHSFVLTATGPGGSSQAVVRVVAKLPAKKLTIKPSSSKPVLAGKTVTLKLSGLAAGETWSVTAAGQVRAQGKANSEGTATAKVKIPSRTAQATLSFRVTGSQPDRTGSAGVWVAAKSAKLKVKAAHGKVRAGYKQKVTVTGLVPGEKVTVTYKGKRISKKTAVANAKGVFTVKFQVGTSWGSKKVKVTGMASSRTGAVSFAVTPRSGSQGGAKGR